MRVLRDIRLNIIFCFLPEQKMDKNKDGVVTIDEFIESCQKVSNESIRTITSAIITAKLSISS